MLRATLTARVAVSDAVTLGFAGFAQDLQQDFDGGFPLTDQANRQNNRQGGARVFAEVRAGNTLHTLEASAFAVERVFNTGGAISRFDGARLGLAWRGETTVSPALAFLYGIETFEERATYANIPGGTATTGLTGGFVQALWAPTAQLDVSAAARVDHNSTFGTFATGRLAVAWRPDEATVVRAAIANGFRAPSIDERFGNYPGLFPFVGNPALQPERSLSAEIGVERQFAGGAQVSATLFLLDTDNLITFVAGAPSTLVNRPGTAQRRGVELAAALPLGARAGLDVAYTYTDAVQASGARLGLVPRHQATATLRADLTDKLRAALTVTHVADRAGQFGGTAPDYTVASASLRHALTDRADIWLRVENLGDAVYEVTPTYGTARRTVHLGVAARF